MKNNIIRVFALALALCVLMLTPALAAQTFEGDANVDQRNYPP